MAKVKQIEGHIPIEIVESALNEGMVEVKSEELMKYFESVAGHRIYTPKPIENKFKEKDELIRQALEYKRKQMAALNKVAPPSPKLVNSKPVGTAAKLPPFMDKSLKLAEMYKMATDESTKLRDSSDVLQKKKYGLSLASRYKEWMTPELFDYLSMKGPRAEAELRAACYPARVAFSHRVQRIDGKIWATPYITIFTPSNTRDAKDDSNIKEEETAYSFYLTKDREIHVIKDEAKRVDTIKSPETRDKQRAENLKAWQNSDWEKRVRLVNPKTGVEQYVLLHSWGTEGWQERYFFKKENAYQWPEIYDMTSCTHEGKIDYDKYWGRGQDLVAIETMGREAISKIPKIVMSTENLRRYTPTLIRGYDKKGRVGDLVKAPKGYEEFLHEGADDFSDYWSQEEMERTVGDWSKEL